MNKDLEQLVQLSKYDIAITQFEPKIATENAKLAVFIKTASVLNKQITNLCEVIDDSKNKRVKNDVHLKELSSKIDEIAQKNKIVKTEREIKALQLEEEIAKEQIDFANDEIVRLDDLISEKEDQLKDLKQKLIEEKDSVKELQISIKKIIEELELARNEVSKHRTQLFEKVDKKVLTFYEKIRRWAKETAVVPLKNQACYGCHIKMGDRVYYEFISSDEIKTCPHCGRILYREEVAEQ